MEAAEGAAPPRNHTGPLLIAGEDADHTRGVWRARLQ
jgi:hypothetical protein